MDFYTVLLAVMALSFFISAFVEYENKKFHLCILSVIAGTLDFATVLFSMTH